MSIENRVQQIQKDIRELKDFEAVRNNLAMYCKAVDNKSIEQLSALFARDVEFSVRPWGFDFQGHDAVIEFYTGAFKDTDESRHYIANEVIEPCEGGYRSSCYFHSTIAAGSESLVGCGNYDDRFVWEDGVLKFQEKKITVKVLTPLAKGWAGPEKIVDVH